MNIKTIYSEMESRNNLNLSVYLGYLQDHVNSNSFSLSEVLSKHNKYLRALCCAGLSPKNPTAFYQLISNDREIPVFTTHMALNKCVGELLNLNNSNTELESLMTSIIDGIRNAKIGDNPGSTLAFAFGFTIGTAIKRGVNVVPFFNKLDSKFITDNGRLFNGLSAALSTDSTLLILNKDYIQSIDERYDNWEERSRLISLSIFKAIPHEKLEVTTILENLKVIQYFSGRSSNFDKFITDYSKNLDAKQLQKQTENQKQNVVQFSNQDQNQDELISAIKEKDSYKEQRDYIKEIFFDSTNIRSSENIFNNDNDISEQQNNDNQFNQELYSIGENLINEDKYYNLPENNIQKSSMKKFFQKTDRRLFNLGLENRPALLNIIGRTSKQDTNDADVFKIKYGNEFAPKWWQAIQEIYDENNNSSINLTNSIKLWYKIYNNNYSNNSNTCYMKK